MILQGFPIFIDFFCGVKDFIDFDQGTFLDLNENPCAAIYDKNSWNFVVNATGAERLKNAGSVLKIYPNPAKNRLIMENFPDSPTPINVDLLTVAGRKVDSFKVPARQTSFLYNSSNLSPGVYLIRFTSKAGISTEKFVKK